VTQAGVSNFVAARSVLPQTARLDVEGRRRHALMSRRSRASELHIR
jgi:hypothetical protein